MNNIEIGDIVSVKDDLNQYHRPVFSELYLVSDFYRHKTHQEQTFFLALSLDNNYKDIFLPTLLPNSNKEIIMKNFNYKCHHENETFYFQYANNNNVFMYIEDYNCQSLTFCLGNAITTCLLTEGWYHEFWFETDMKLELVRYCYIDKFRHILDEINEVFEKI